MKLRSLLRLVRSSSRVRIRSRPTSVLPVKKSALMRGRLLGFFFVGFVLHNCYVRIDNPEPNSPTRVATVRAAYARSDALSFRLAPWRIVSTHTACRPSSTS